MSTQQEWAEIAEQAERSAAEHEVTKEVRLLKSTIERQQARLIAMDATLENGSPELETARKMYPLLVKLQRWAKGFQEVHGQGPHQRGGTLVRGDIRDELLQLAHDLAWLTKRLDEQRQKPCDEPGCILRPRVGYWDHWHTDGYRQWKTVETSKGTRRFKRGAW